MTSLSRAGWGWLVALGPVLACPSARAQSCTTTTSRGGLSEYNGEVIRSLRIEGLDLRPFPLVGHALQHVHVSTREATIRRELLFTQGDLVDSLKVAESMRRLRSLTYLDDAMLVAQSCPDSVGVALTVVTRDLWTTIPVLDVRPGSLLAGFDDGNTLGTGRAARVAVQSDVNGTAIDESMSDPALFNSRFKGNVGSGTYADGASVSGSIGLRNRTLADLWSGGVWAAVTDRHPYPAFENSLSEYGVGATLGRRMTDTTAPAATYLKFGADAEETLVAWNNSDPLIGPLTVNRRYAMLMIGLSRRSSRSDTLDWVLPYGGLGDLPRGLEADASVAAGPDLLTGGVISRLGLWARRVWHPVDGQAIMITQVWASGFSENGAVSNGEARGSLFAATGAGNGLWTFRFDGERLANPDPTVRSNATVDPTAMIIPAEARLARGTVAGYLERSFHIRPVTAGNMLDAGIFTAGSYRWDPDTATEASAVGVGVIGAGLRLGAERAPKNTLRLDLSYPFWEQGQGIGHHPFLTVSVTPSIF